MGGDISPLAEGITWAMTCSIVVVAVVIDLVNNPLHHPTPFIRYRTINWLLCGLSYALSYMGRYNISVANVDAVKNYYDCQDSYGTIILVGNVAYAACVIINGYMVDKIGARKGIIIGTLGSGILNLLMGLVCLSDLKGTSWVTLMSILYAINNYFQTYSTSSICKAGVNWYHIKERGVFSGIFGVVISFGFFLAYGVDGALLHNDATNTPLIFFIPGVILLIFCVLDYLFVRALPEDQFDDEMLVNLRPPGFDRSTLCNQKPAFMTVIKPIISQSIFAYLAIIEVFIGWCRDGILNWYPSFIQDHYDQSSSSIVYTIAYTGVTVGGMFGSLFTGTISDKLFNARRQPAALLDLGLLLVMQMGMAFWYGRTDTGMAEAWLITGASVFFSGVHGIVTSTAAMDFAGSGATGTAVGMLDGIQKLGSAVTGPGMAKIVNSGPDGYYWWIISMMPAAIIDIILFLIILKRKPKEMVEESKIDGRETSTLIHSRQSAEDLLDDAEV
ncbi:sugar phosphate transporter [Kipferlia bialata]|uniref:Sugar phosphate transporter n=1 Tax=Kipferlia bialata TaxID=797122 RepID=A0A9K3CR58_9EUKA|nr:sugar phosphate transporter [Kipferlia bialata]|eukprot:g1812.t1